jgi:LPS-assembly lipoprotein
MWWSKLREVLGVRGEERRRVARFPFFKHDAFHGSSTARSSSRLTPYASLAACLLALSLTSCGFALRGSYELPYKTLFVTSSGNSVVAGQIRREIADTQTRIVAASKDAEAALTILEERRDRQILSLSGAGRVREFELRMKVTYQFVDAKGLTIIPTSEILLKRTFAYDDTRVIAKQQEETMLYQDMERDATGQILRRMIAVKRAS